MEDRRREGKEPWSVPVVVMQIPEGGLHRDVEADAIECEALARAGSLREVLSARASFDVTPTGKGGVHVVGSVTARVGQECVVTLDPIENDLVETIDLMFVPAEQMRELAASVDDGKEGVADTADPPEPIVNGIIDLGRVAADALFLGIDPYPRKADVAFEPPSAAADPDDHPFAALKVFQTVTLQTPPSPKSRKKP